MGKYIDWYLVEMEGQAMGGMRADRIHDLISESQAHLEDAAGDLQAKGMSEKDAELAAIERFGRVRDVVSNTSTARRLFSSTGAVLSLGGLGLVLLYYLCADWQRVSFATEQFAMGALMLVFACFAFLCRRVIWREIGAVALALFVINFFAYGTAFGGPGNFKRSEIPMRTTTLGGQRAQVQAEIDRLSTWQVAFQQRKPNLTHFQVPSRLDYSYLAYGVPVPHVVYSSKTSVDDARAGWAQASYFDQRLADARQALGRRQGLMQSAGATTVWQSGISHLADISIYAFGPPLLGLLANIVLFWLGVSWRRDRSVYRRRFA